MFVGSGQARCLRLGAVLALVFAGCLDRSVELIAIDGSSTVYPITEAVAEAYREKAPIRITIGVSGTGGGFQKFCSGETNITGASRVIKSVEMERCQKAGIEFIELPVAYDGIVVAVHPSNDWVEHLTVSQLKKIWEPAAQREIMRWVNVAPGWPDRELHLFGPGVDSGTFDYFSKAIVGEEGASRGDFTSSEDDNVLVQGVSTDPAALGFFGYGYYAENQDKLRRIPIDDEKDNRGQGPILPSPATVADGSYQPLSRPIFVYVRRDAANLPSVEAFMKFYLANAAALTPEVGYIPLSPEAYSLAAERFERRITGTIFGGGRAHTTETVAEILRGQGE